MIATAGRRHVPEGFRVAICKPSAHSGDISRSANTRTIPTTNTTAELFLVMRMSQPFRLGNLRMNQVEGGFRRIRARGAGTQTAPATRAITPRIRNGGYTMGS
jgi:hypothetical protein